MWSLNVTVHIDIPLPVTDWLCITFVSETWLNKWFQCIGAEWTTQKHVPHSDPMMVCIRMATQQPFLKQQRKWRLLPSHNALHDKLPHTHTHTHTHTRATCTTDAQLPPSFPPASGSPPSRPNALWGRAEWRALWWHVYGGSEQRGTWPGVVAQVIHYNVTSEEEMKQSRAPCASCHCMLLKKHGGG